MPKFWSTCGIISLIMVASGMVGAADKPIKVAVNSQVRPFNPTALVRDGKAYLPMRPFANAIMGGLKYDPATGTVSITYCSHTAKLKKSQGITVNGSFYVPLRTVADALAININWDPRAALVDIDLGGG